MNQSMYALDFEGRIIPITKSHTRIGRHLNNDIVINNVKVSRSHAKICLINDSVFIEDLKTINGTFIATEKILAERLTNLKVNDTIGIGCKSNEDKECSMRLIQLKTESLLNSSDVIPKICQNIKNSFSTTPIQSQGQIINIENVNVNFEFTKGAEGKDHEPELYRKKVINYREDEKLNIEVNHALEHVEKKNSHSSSNTSTAEGNREKRIKENHELKTKTDSTCADTSKVKYEGKDTVEHNSKRKHSGKRSATDGSNEKLNDGKRKNENSRSSSSKTQNVEKSERSEKTKKVDKASSSSKSRHDAGSSSSKSKHRKRSSRSRTSSENEDLSEKPSFGNKKRNSNSNDGIKARKTSDSKDKVSSNTTIMNGTKSHRNGVEYEQHEQTSDVKPALEVDSNCDVKFEVEIPVESKQMFPVSSPVLEAKKPEKKLDDVINLVENDESTPTKSDVIDLVKDDQSQMYPSVDLVNSPVDHIDLIEDDEPVSTFNTDFEQPTKTYISILDDNFIDISSDEEFDDKSGAREEVNYSKSEEIVSLDSDDEDFPSSQMLNTTTVDSVPDYSPSLQMLYESIKEEPEEQSPILQCYDSTWFEPLSQGNYIEEKMVPKMKVVDSPDHSVGSPELPTRTSLELSDGENEKEMFIDEIEERLELRPFSVVLKRSSECEIKVRKRKSTESIDDDNDDAQDLVRHKKSVATKSPFRRDDEHSASTFIVPPIISPMHKKRRRRLKNSDSLGTTLQKNHHRRLYECPTLSQKQRIKEVRKEKLKKLTIESTTKTVPDVVLKPKAVPVVKVTDRNRNSMLVDAFVNDKKKANEVLREVSMSNGASNTNLAGSIRHSSTSNEEYRWTDPSDAELAENVWKSSKTTIYAELTTNSYSKKPIERKLNNVAGKRRVKILKSAKKSEEILADNGSTMSTKKKVTFASRPKIAEIDYHPEEQSLKSETMCLVRLRDQTTSNCVNELDMSIAHMCSWSVCWLKEQAAYQTPPPVYKPVFINDENRLTHDPIEKYREHLKYLLFLQLWKALFNEWNTTGNNIVPNTQCLNEKNVFVFIVEKIDTIQDKNTLMITAARTSKDINNVITGNEIQIGQVMIINLQVTCRGDKMLRKTMIFGYVSHVVNAVDADSLIRQRVWIKTAPIKADIVLGPIKLKVIQFIRKYLIPFQALAMLSKSPLTNCILNPSALPEISFDFLNEQKYLCSAQKIAIMKCLNAIFSKVPGLCVIDGAPGTGKSQIIVSLLNELYSTNRKFDLPEDMKILIITPFDNNADDLCYRIQKGSKTSVNVLRYGNDRGTHPTVKSCSLQKKIDDLLKGDSSNELIDLNAEKNTLQAKIRSTQLVLLSAENRVLSSAENKKQAEARSKLEIWQRELDDLNNENSRGIERLKTQMAKRISLTRADVVITSSQSCWSSGFEYDFFPYQKNSDAENFTVCIIDDANRLPEYFILCPIMLMVSTLILIGDSKNRISCIRTKSLFDKIRQMYKMVIPKELVTLDVGYRLHPIVQTWINKQFGTCAKRFQLKSAKVKPLVVLDFSTIESLCDDVEMTYLFIDLILEIDRIEEKTTKLGVIVFDNEQKEIVKSLLKDSRIFDYRKVVIDRMDEFSGREYDIIVVNLPHKVFFDDSFLYNIATRAIRSLIVCGNFSHDVLKRVPAVGSLIEHAKFYNSYVPNPTRANLSSFLFVNSG